jgi:hypothetical protein
MNNKFGLSKKGIKCIGPCYPPNSKIVHPHTLDIYNNKSNYSVCPIHETLIDGELHQFDKCEIAPKNKNSKLNSQSSIHILVPDLDMTDEYFLNQIYSIYSFNDALAYITKFKLSPLLSRMRIINCAWSVYGQEVNIIDDILTDLYMEVVENIWQDYIYNKIKKVSVYKITKSKLLKLYNTKEEIYKFLVKNIKYKPNNKLPIINKYNIIEHIKLLL